MKPPKILSSNQQLGKRGEDVATAYLTSHGYCIIQRNFRAGYGELDIIAIIDDTLVVVEVKTRTGRTYGLPIEAVTSRKLNEIVKTLQYYVLTHPGLPKQLRIDVIGIEMNHTKKVVHIDHQKNVTG